MTGISEIKIGARYRKDMGDLQALADSIKAQGLLQPIGVTENLDLVFGERRLRACRDILGWTEIAARVVNVTSLIEGERDENEVRKDFTTSERVAIAQAIEEEIGRRQGTRTDRRELRQNLAKVEGPAKGQRTDAFAAKKAGFGNRETYRQAEAVLRAAVPELMAALDKGDVSIDRAFKLLDQPEPVQRKIAKAPKAEQARIMRGIRYDVNQETNVQKAERVLLAIETLLKAPMTAVQFRSFALPHTLKTARLAIPTVLEYLTDVQKVENDQTRPHQAA